MISSGINWCCPVCGAAVRKRYHIRARVDYLSRPPCPFCGAFHAIIHSGRGKGVRYQCGECGHVWRPRTSQSHTLNNHVNLAVEVL